MRKFPRGITHGHRLYPGVSGGLELEPSHACPPPPAHPLPLKVPILQTEAALKGSSGPTNHKTQCPGMRTEQRGLHFPWNRGQRKPLSRFCHCLFWNFFKNQLHRRLRLSRAPSLIWAAPKTRPHFNLECLAWEEVGRSPRIGLTCYMFSSELWVLFPREHMSLL